MNEEQKNSVSQATAGKSLRPVLIASEYTFADYSIFLHHLLAGLADESIPVALVCPKHCDADAVVSGAVEVIRYPAIELPLMGWQNRKMLVEQLEKFQPTVLHCLCRSEAALTGRLAKQLDLPYVLTVNSMQKKWGWFSVSSRRCAKIIVPAKSIADNIAKLYPNFAHRVEQINIGTFVARTTGCFSEPDRLVSMVTAHPLNRAEEFENLLAAVKHLAIDGYEFMLVIIGSGPAERQLRKLLLALGLLKIVVNVPTLQPARSVLAAGDIFIQPQPTIFFNPFLLEAMSVGSAVAACKGGVDDLIMQGETCVAFNPADELSIYSSLQRLFGSRHFARQIADGAQQYLRENHSVSKMVSSILQTYHDAQQESGR